uniref:Uncharacterized protein n=1 Tax=Citrobacter freundii TaxID=546 RepID=A0A3T0VB52_CITFR|nr:Hypothetical protein [Citrobacter freundii]
MPVIRCSSVNVDNQNRRENALSAHVTGCRYVQKASVGSALRVRISGLQYLSA